MLAWWKGRPSFTFFVDGNHENHDVIDVSCVMERFSGRVQVIPGCPCLINLMRGEVYPLLNGDMKARRSAVDSVSLPCERVRWLIGPYLPYRSSELGEDMASRGSI